MDNPYDLVPYGDHCHRRTHPDRLCAVGRLFGIEAADPRRARVLELGCAGGSNLIPMAYELPDAEFLGVDLSEIQIEAGRRRVSEIGLENISLRTRSITDIGPDDGQFDYIICHGVYSWVAPDVQRAIFGVGRACLAPHGVALVSYNTLPGWNMVRSFREMALYHTKDIEDPQEKVEQTRALIRFVLETSAASPSPWTEFLRSELELLSRYDDSYLLHDHLEVDNHPAYFHEFIAAAREHGLDYLADSDLVTMLPENLAAPAAATLREIEDIVRTEQYMDFVRNRRFRSTLLRRADRAVNRELDAANLKPFYLTASFRFEDEIDPRHVEHGVEVKFDLDGSRIRLSDGVAKAALAILGRTRSARLTYEELVARTADLAGIEDLAEVERRIDENLVPLRMLFAGALEIHSLPGSFATELAERPVASELARVQARDGSPVTSFRHEKIELPRVQRVLIQHLDGTRDVAELAVKLREHIDKGDLEIEHGEGDPPEGDVLDSALRDVVRMILEKLRDVGLLAAES